LRADGGDAGHRAVGEKQAEELTQSTLMNPARSGRPASSAPRFLAAPAQTAERAALGFFAILR